MSQCSLKEMTKPWANTLESLGMYLEITGEKDDKHLQITDMKTKQRLQIKGKTFESKVNEQGLEQVLATYTAFLKDWQQVLNEPVEIRLDCVFPCIRPKSLLQSKAGKELQWFSHTNETIIVLALDQGKGYKLLRKKEVENTSLSPDEWLEKSKSNLSKLPYSVKKQTVAENDFYFFHQNDGYDASRILLESLWLQEVGEAREKLTLSIPHQDVLIVAKINNDEGLQILAKMTMEFYTEGRSPITSFSFHYPDGQAELEPIFIFLK